MSDELKVLVPGLPLPGLPGLGCESGPCHVDFLMMISRNLGWIDFFFSIWQAASPKKTQENRVFS